MVANNVNSFLSHVSAVCDLDSLLCEHVYRSLGALLDEYSNVHLHQKVNRLFDAD